MSNMICVDKSKPSAVKRLKFLPRIGFVVDFAGREVTFRGAPIIETLVNLKERGFSVKNFMEVAYSQLSEINLKKQPTIAEACGPAAPKSSKPKKKAKKRG